MAVRRIPCTITFDIDSDTDIDAMMLLDKIKLTLPKNVNIKINMQAVACFEVFPPMRLIRTDKITSRRLTFIERNIMELCVQSIMMEEVISILERKCSTIEKTVFKSAIEKLLILGMLEIVSVKGRLSNVKV